MKFDNVFNSVGEFGRYQKLLTFFASILIFANVFSNISTVFISGDMDHYCRSVDDIACQATDWCLRTNLTLNLPPDDEETLLIDESKCRMYADNNKTELTTCEYGWTYDQSQFKSTIVSEFDLVCEHAYKVSLSQSLYLAGFLVGSISFGFMCDYFGRKKTIFIGYSLLLLMGIVTGLSMSFWFYAVSRFICGITDIGPAIAAFTYITEIVAPSKRAVATTYVNVLWCFGMMILAVIAYFIRSWDILLFVNSASVLPLLLLFFFVPESPRWLLVKGKLEEAEGVLRRIAKRNKVANLPDGFFKNLELETKLGEDTKTTTNPLDIIKYPEMRKKTIYMAYSWFAINLSYYGLTYGIEEFSADIYIGIFLGGITELLASLFTWFCIQKIGRRFSLAGSLVSGGLACFINIWIPLEMVALRTTVSMIGRFFITAALLIAYVFTAELYPTVIRTTGLGICSLWSRIAGVLAPQILFLEKIWKPLPLVAFSFTSLSAGLLALLLPETLNFPLPQTIEEAELFTRESNRRYDGDCQDISLQSRTEKSNDLL